MSNRLIGMPVLAAAILAALTLGGCREGEQGRPLMYEKGVYLGQKDTRLTDQQRKALESRAALQATGAGTSLDLAATPPPQPEGLRDGAGRQATK